MALDFSDLTKDVSRFEFSPTRGFLAGFPSVASLPKGFESWDRLGENLPKWIKSGNLRDLIHKLPLLDVSRLTQRAEQERALLILALAGHAYLHLPGHAFVSHLPASIAVPWFSLAREMKRPVVLHHASYALYNWTFSSENQHFTPKSLKPNLSFLNTSDEHGFIVVTVAVEAEGAKALMAALEAFHLLSTHQKEKGEAKLQLLIEQLEKMSALLDSMPRYCKPEAFYNEIRPFLNGFSNLEFEGTGQTISYEGGSAAQSTLIQALDRVMGITHQTPYLQAMRAYMPRPHAALLENLPNLTKLDLKGSAYDMFEEAIAALRNFRSAHLRLAAQYIIQFEQKEKGEVAKGTGGTELLPFLRKIRNETQSKGNNLTPE